MKTFLSWLCLMIVGGVLVLLAGSCAPDAWIREPAPYEIFRVRRVARQTWVAEDNGYFIRAIRCVGQLPVNGWAFMTNDWHLVFNDPGAKCRIEMLGPVIAQP